MNINYNEMEKKYWMCTVCGDMHWGADAPEICPTCGYEREKSTEITKEEFLGKIE